MSISFWVSIVVSALALVEAIDTHRETVEQMAADSGGSRRRRHRLKLWLCWSLFVAGLTGSIVTAIEGKSAERAAAGQQTVITNATNEVAWLRTEHRSTSNRLIQTESQLRNATNQLAAQDLELLKSKRDRELMEYSMSPREFDSIRYKHYLDELSKFPGTVFVIAALDNDECRGTAQRIVHLLDGAGWKRAGMISLSGWDVRDGIWIECPGLYGDTNNLLSPAMDALRDAITDSSMMANCSSLSRSFPMREVPTNALCIVVGARPDYYMRSKKFERESKRGRIE